MSSFSASSPGESSGTENTVEPPEGGFDHVEELEAQGLVLQVLLDEFQGVAGEGQVLGSARLPFRQCLDFCVHAGL